MAEIAERVSMNASSLPIHMARLQKQGRLEKVPPPKRQFGKGGVTAIFIKTGTELTHAPITMAPAEDDGPKYSLDFIKVAHNCLFLRAA